MDAVGFGECQQLVVFAPSVQGTPRGDDPVYFLAGKAELREIDGALRRDAKLFGGMTMDVHNGLLRQLPLNICATGQILNRADLPFIRGPAIAKSRAMTTIRLAITRIIRPACR